MSVQVDVVYLGDLHTEATHGPSQHKLLTDAPLDNGGKGEAFSPTDLVGTALGTCVLTILGLYAKRNGLEVKGATARVLKEMTAVPIRRIARLATEVRIPLAADHPHRAAIEQAIRSCPVHASLYAEMEKPIDFVWEG